MTFEQTSCPPLPSDWRGLQRMDEILALVLTPLGLPQSPTEKLVDDWELLDDWADYGAGDAEGEPALCLLEAAAT